MSLFTSCALRAADVYNLALSHLRFDTTSMSLQGDYNFPETAKLPFFPKHGHSKDHRPDLKQIVMTTPLWTITYLFSFLLKIGTHQKNTQS